MTSEHHLEPEYGTGKKTLKIYFIGLLLCAILTLVPFLAVFVHSAPASQTSDYPWLMNAFSGLSNLKSSTIYTIIFVCALIQFFVQVKCFLRLNLQTEQGKANVYSFIFAMVILLVVVVGTMWIMYTLHHRMMDNGGNMSNMPIVMKAE
jgi:cytochrome o ubiquinol oxidase subunit IV